MLSCSQIKLRSALNIKEIFDHLRSFFLFQSYSTNGKLLRTLWVLPIRVDLDLFQLFCDNIERWNMRNAEKSLEQTEAAANFKQDLI